MKNAINILKDFKQNGVFDKDFPFEEDGREKFLDEKSGIWIGDFPAIILQWIKKHPDKKVEDCLEVVRPWKAK